MHRVFALATVVVAVLIGSALSAQQLPPMPPRVSSSVFAPASVACSAPFSSSVTLTGYDVEEPGVADVVLVLDESDSIDSWVFELTRLYATDLIHMLISGGARVGLATFSGDARTVLNLSDNVLDVMTGLYSVSQRQGAACIGCGIQQGQTIFADSPPRPAASQFMIVVTAGQNTVDVEQFPGIVSDAKQAGIQFLSVGVGANIDPSVINLIASEIPEVQTAFFSGDLWSLAPIVSQLTSAIVSPAATNVSVVLDAMPRFPVTGASATAGTVTVTGNNVVWTLPGLGAASQTLTVDHQHDGTGSGSMQVFSATYSEEPSRHGVWFDTPSTVVSSCNVAPVANAGNDQSVSATGPATAVALDGSGSTDDGLTQPLSYAWSSDTGVVASGVAPVVMLPVGTHTFTLTVSDGEFSDADTVVVTVADTTAPEIDSVTPSTGMLWPPNHRMVPVSVTVAATDNVDAAPMCTITGVTSSEADNGRGDGNTTGDAVVTGPLTVELRSERGGRGDGRVYTIQVTCTDAAGNASTSSTRVTAPKSQGR